MMNRRVLVTFACLLALLGCEEHKPAPQKPQTQEEIFKAAEKSANESEFPDNGRFVPQPMDGKVAILDTKLGNVWYYDWDADRWMRIDSPLSTGVISRQSFKHDGHGVAPPVDYHSTANVFDTIPADDDVMPSERDRLQKGGK